VPFGLSRVASNRCPVFLTITFLLLGVGEMTGKHGVTVAGGAFGIVRLTFFVLFVLMSIQQITAFNAFYVGLCKLLPSQQNSAYSVLQAACSLPLLPSLSCQWEICRRRCALSVSSFPAHLSYTGLSTWFMQLMRFIKFVIRRDFSSSFLCNVTSNKLTVYGARCMTLRHKKRFVMIDQLREVPRLFGCPTP
jgi:hypothetical protein